MKKIRVIAFFDGFNLYHAIQNLKVSEYKWLDIKKLSLEFIHPIHEELLQVHYFSTLATHRNQEAQIRQKKYLKALEIIGVKTVFGNFKQKQRDCPKCYSPYWGNEEKETDVNIALALIDLAYQNAYERAILVTNDSDQVPSIRRVLELFPNKTITILIPPHTRECNELIKVASNKAKITSKHLEKCLLPEKLNDSLKGISVTRPHEYEPALVELFL